MTKKELIEEIERLEISLTYMDEEDPSRWTVIEKIAELKEALRRLRRLEELER